MFCTQCGKKSSENSAYCFNCGAKLTQGVTDSKAQEVEQQQTEPAVDVDVPPEPAAVADIAPDPPVPVGRPGNIWSLVRALWHGDVPLWKTYWLFGVIGNLVFNVALFYIEITADRFYSVPGSVAVFWSIAVASLAYAIWVLVGIWRSAGRYLDERRGLVRYGILARFSVLLGGLRTLTDVLSIFGLDMSSA